MSDETETTIDIKGLDPAAVLAALYNAAKPQGLGFLQYDPKPMDLKEAQELLKEEYFDYLNGRVMKIRIGKDSKGIDPRLYDRDNGKGAAAGVIANLREYNEVNSVEIQAHHIMATRRAVDDVKREL